MRPRTFVFTCITGSLATLLASVVRAQAPLLDEIRTIADPAVAAAVERNLDVTIAGIYELTLTDLAVPSSLESVQMAVTRGTTIVATVATDPQNLSQVVSFEATAGAYTLRLVGTPQAAARTGGVGVKVTRPADAATILELAEQFSLPPPATPENRTVLDTTFNVTDAGDYEVVLSDLQLPQDLPTLTLAITSAGGSSLLVNLPAAGSATFTATPGDYRLFAIAEADIDVKAGLFNVNVRSSASGATLFNQSLPVGHVERLGAVVLSAGDHVLTFTDFQFPVGLAQSGIVLTRNGQIAARTAFAGDTPFTAIAGEHHVFALAIASAVPGTGSYGLEVRPAAGSPVFTAVETVGDATGPTPAYSFVVDIPAAGTYTARLADFQFPAAFDSASNAFRLAATQDGAVLGTVNGAGTIDIDPAAGKLFLLVIARPLSQQGGVFGIDLTPEGGGEALFEITQGVGKLFSAFKVSIFAPGSYRVSVQDVGFPAPFADLAAVVTRGAERAGSIFSGGVFDFTATPGNYVVNFIAGPARAADAGTYALTINDKPPDPTLTFQASPREVTSGGTVELSWSTDNATSCTASGAWTGSRPTSGSETTPQITASTTFTLECQGDGGTVTRSVTVDTIAPQTGGGGGGALDWLLVSTLLLGAARRLTKRARLVHRKKSPMAIFSRPYAVSGRERRDFRGLLRRASASPTDC